MNAPALHLDSKDSICDWYESPRGVYHPIMLATVRCHARVDDPGAPGFTVEGEEVFTVPGRYCGNMHVCNQHETEGRSWDRVFVGRLVPDIQPSGTETDHG